TPCRINSTRDLRCAWKFTHDMGRRRKLLDFTNTQVVSIVRHDKTPVVGYCKERKIYQQKSRLAVSLAAFSGIFSGFTVYELPFPSPAASEMHKSKRKRVSCISCF